MEVKESTMRGAEGLSLRGEYFGSPISQKLSDHLKAYTSSNDRANVSINTGVGSSTIRDVTYRNNNLTEDNSKAIIALIQIAIDNCRAAIENAKVASRELNAKIK